MEITQEIQEYVDPEKHEEITRSLEAVKVQADKIVVADKESFGLANDLLVTIDSRIKGLESFRLAIVKPFKDHLKRIDDFFGRYKDAFGEVKVDLTKKIVGYRELMAKHAKKTDTDAPAKTNYQDDGSRVTYRKYGEWKIVSEGKLPEEFWCPDEKKIGARVRELTKDLEVGRKYASQIPGVEITITERPSINAEG